MAEGFDAEEIGMVALIGLLLLPGVMWIAKGKTAASKIGRTALVGCLVAVAVKVEASMDDAAKEITE